MCWAKGHPGADRLLGLLQDLEARAVLPLIIWWPVPQFLGL